MSNSNELAAYTAIAHESQHDSQALYSEASKHHLGMNLATAIGLFATYEMHDITGKAFLAIGTAALAGYNLLKAHSAYNRAVVLDIKCSEYEALAGGRTDQ